MTGIVELTLSLFTIVRRSEDRGNCRNNSSRFGRYTGCEEARVIASEMGCKAIAVYDVGVAGIHGFIPELQRLKAMKPRANVVAAGREETLPTIVFGLVDVPVIWIQVSTGYGVGGGGKAALLSMLQSCSPLQ